MILYYVGFCQVGECGVRGRKVGGGESEWEALELGRLGWILSRFGIISDNYHKLRIVLLSASNAFTTLNLTHL